MFEELKTILGGVGSPLEWFFKGAKPVPQKQSCERASTCVICKKNVELTLTEFFTEPAAELLQKSIEARTHLKLSTQYDPLLGTCNACFCVLKLKVHEPIDLILKHLKPQVKEKLWEECWILREEPPQTPEKL